MQCGLNIIWEKMLSTNVLCMKKRKKRSYYISEASDYIPRPSKDKDKRSQTAMMQITEDTPPDMLAGAMDLTIHLPNSRTVKMSVERSTPMMDLLMQITTAHHLQHSGHILQALEMASSAGPTDKILPYKPNTPIGSLETQHVKVVAKNRSNSMPKVSAIGQQPFESTFRLQVHLPRNQLYVIRVSQYVFLEDIMKKVCDEKNLDIRKYEFRHPGHLDEVLDPKLTLSDYQITEVYLVAKGTVGLTQAFFTSDIMALKKEEERKQLQARTGGGVFNLIFKRGKPSFGSGSVSSDTRSISPSHSDDSRSVTPPGIQQQILPVTQQPIADKPKPPQRKRRPAPKPPQRHSPESSQVSTISDSNTSELKTTENGLTICHSRNSSDSSGYHEPSVLSDHCNLSLPRRTNVINEVVNEESQSSESNRSSANLSSMGKFSKSTTSIASRKKKAAPPPPALVHSQSVIESVQPSHVVASPVVDVQDSLSTIPTLESAPVSISSTPSYLSKQQPFENPLPLSQQEPSNSPLEKTQSPTFEYPKDNFVEPEPELENDWQYQLPSPPTAFRDLSPTNLTDVTNYDTVTIAEFKGDSVIPDPMLFEKLELVKDHQSEVETVSDLSEEERPMLNKLTLENLEKRKSLVYNRELSTSLKIAQNGEESVQNSHAHVINELEDVIHNGRGKTLSRHNSTVEYNDKNLPNFQISTYDKPKSKVNIFEDDSVRSNDEVSKTIRNRVDQDVFKKPQEFGQYKVLSRTNFFVKNNAAPTSSVMRSESFSSSNRNVYKWKPHNPVQRSKSQVALNQYKEDAGDDITESLSKSNSLFDVSGLQSLEVMRMIQTKLGSTPTSSSEQLLEEPTPPTPAPVIEVDKPDSAPKTYRYQGPPAINLSTWSERPKTKVSLKEDTDYRSNAINETKNSNNVSIKINGSEAIRSGHPGNVVIKIGELESKNSFSSRFGPGYRKPLSNINKNGRPHSISMDMDIDTSRVPVVRSVELKKPFNNKSVTQINSNELANNIRNKFMGQMTEQKVNGTDPVNNGRFGPTVMGFRSANRWNVNNYNTLPTKMGAEPTTNYAPNSNVPFSQVTLRRVESNKRTVEDTISAPKLYIRHSTGSTTLTETIAPPPPTMPKIKNIKKKSVKTFEPVTDPRDDLLNSIRNFGGVNGLKRVNV